MRAIKRLSALTLGLILGVCLVPAVSAQVELPTIEITEDTVLTDDIAGFLVITAANITLDCDGHSITGDGGGASMSIGVHITADSDATVQNCVVTGFFDGIVARGTGHRILDNEISDVDFGIGVRGTDIVISGNQITRLLGIGLGISVTGSMNRVEDNIVADLTDSGVYVVAEAPGGNLIRGNVLTGGNLGIEDPDTWYLNSYEKNTCVDNAAGPSNPIWLCSPDLEGPFVDDDASVFQDAIEWLFWKGITAGCNPPINDGYCPNDLVTRGHMAVFVSRAVPLYLPDPSVDYFTDDDGRFFEGGANRLLEAGITEGCGLGLFCGDRPLTREEMAVFVVRALDPPLSTDDFFIDDEDSPYEDHINRIAEAGITVGCNPPASDRFCPTDPVTRGQAAAFIKRAWGE